LSLERITRLEDVPRFLEGANRLAALSWQGRKLGSTVAGTRERLRTLEERTRQGWLRSYLLRGGGTAIAFVVGFQDSGTYIYSQPGYDPKWAEYSPGNVCLYRIIQDLFEHDRPEWMDFDVGDNHYKSVFSTQSRDVQNVYLMRRSAYTGLALLTHRIFSGVSSGVRHGLDRLGLREKVRHILRAGGKGSGAESR
jgi:CelD/BcsL family acetyltransferase involved in cellulose biosynthesis